MTLWNTSPGDLAEVCFVTQTEGINRSGRNRLLEVGIVPGVFVYVEAVDRELNLMRVYNNGATFALARELAEMVLVEAR